MTGIGHGGIVGVFTEAEAVRLTGVSLRQLRYWDRTKFFVPSLASDDRTKPFSRLYSFRDLVSLRVIDRLRNEAKVSFPHLREVKSLLGALSENVWSATTLNVHDRRVAFVNPSSRILEEVVSGQALLAIAVGPVQEEMAAAVRHLRRRDEGDVGRITRRRGIVGNQPVVAGTRITVRSIQAFAAAGFGVPEIKRHYPALAEADIEAAIAYQDAA